MQARNWQNFLESTAAVALLLLAAGCVASNPEKASIVAQPKTAPVRTITSFSASLSCMDDLFLANKIEDIVITSAGIPDATGRIGGGTKDMLISAISRMSIKSKAFAFIDFDQKQRDVAALQELIGIRDEFRVPNYYIRGAITQLDANVQSSSASVGVNVGAVNLGVGKEDTVSLISIDLNVANLITRQILHGVSASNSIAIKRQSSNADGGASFGKVVQAGLSFNVSLGQSEGAHQATRTLIELTAIEILGKLAQVPYWRCLQIDQTNPHVMAQARGWYDSMEAKDRVRYAQRFLASTGDYQGSETGMRDTVTRLAIARFQAENDLIASGRVDFDLYYRMIGMSGENGRIVPLEKVAAVPIMKKMQIKRPKPPIIDLTTPKGASPIYRLGDTLKVLVKVDSDAYIYCYYSDANGQIARIFPNRFRPDSLLKAGAEISIPGEDAQFDLVMDKEGKNEQVVCYAAKTEVGLNIPENLKVEDLTPLPVSSVAELTKSYKATGNTPVAVGQVRISVTR